mmetsp:Transcript_14698/g.30967  ORF Transcript_14698/g.30967 Transcript_14698/m.30967 type:complete len:106 (+) Transcript_14698:110-427(+)
MYYKSSSLLIASIIWELLIGPSSSIAFIRTPDMSHNSKLINKHFENGATLRKYNIAKSTKVRKRVWVYSFASALTTQISLTMNFLNSLFDDELLSHYDEIRRYLL